LGCEEEMFRRRKKKRAEEKPIEEEITLENIRPEEFEEEEKKREGAGFGEEKPSGEEMGFGEEKPSGEEMGFGEEKPSGEEMGFGEEKPSGEEMGFGGAGAEGVGDEIMTSEEVSAEVDKLRGAVPSFILKDLKNSLEGRNITRDQFNKISERILETVDKTRLDKRIEDMYSQVGKLTHTVESIGKMMGAGIPEGEKEKEKYPTKYPIGEKEARREIIYAKKPTEERELKLTRIPPGPTSSRLLLKWMGFLMERVGYEGCIEALNHYVDIGWISEDVYIDLSKLVRSFGAHWQTTEKPVGYLTPTDHLRSLLFIEELSGKKREAIEEA
jgi:flagellar protein FlaD